MNCGDTGLLVAPRSPKDLAAAIFDLYTQEDTARSLGKRARARVVSQFPLSASIDTYGDVYDALDVNLWFCFFHSIF